jgi:hypothetical protein
MGRSSWDRWWLDEGSRADGHIEKHENYVKLREASNRREFTAPLLDGLSAVFLNCGEEQDRTPALLRLTGPIRASEQAA